MRVTVFFIVAFLLSLLWSTSSSTQTAASLDVRQAVEKSLPRLQSIGPSFIENTGCVSCHHNALPTMAVAVARSRGLTVDDQTARTNLLATMEKVQANRDNLLHGKGIGGDATTVSYILIGLAADKQPADKYTDAMAHYLLGKQAGDGCWRPVAYRPPMEFSNVTTTAVTIRAIQLYAPQGRAEEVAKRTASAREWLRRTTPKTNEERTFQLFGLHWAKAEKRDLDQAVKGLLAEQREDGGWAQLQTLESDAYATGQTLVALHEAGGLAASLAAYQRGVKFLLQTQKQDGSWLVQSRSIPFQRYFESGFPHGKNQWISAAGSSWATMALALSLPAR